MVPDLRRQHAWRMLGWSFLLAFALTAGMQLPPLAPAPTLVRADTLGTVWNEVENGGGCQSVWTRTGTTSTFSAVYPGCGVTATLTITISGQAVSVNRYQSSDGNDCTYQGTLGANGTSVSGTYSCTRIQPPPPGAWSATIVGGQSTADTLKEMLRVNLPRAIGPTPEQRTLNGTFAGPCTTFQGEILDRLNILHAQNPTAFQNLDYGPIGNFTDGPNGPNSVAHHVGVVVFTKGSDWHQTGIVVHGVVAPSQYAGLGLFGLVPNSGGNNLFTGLGTYVDGNYIYTGVDRWQVGDNLLPNTDTASRFSNFYFGGTYPTPGERNGLGGTVSCPVAPNAQVLGTQSPVDLLITNAHGRRVQTHGSRIVLDEISATIGFLPAYMTKDDRTNTFDWNIILPPDTYQVVLTGNGSGPYTLSNITYDVTGTGHLATQTGTITPGAQRTYVATASGPLMPADTMPPIVTLSVPAPIHGTNGWYNAQDTLPVVASVTADDTTTGGSSITAIACTDNGGTATSLTLSQDPGNASRATASYSVSGDGVHLLVCTATDSAGNTGASLASGSQTPMNKATVKIDRVAPSCQAAATPSSLWPPNHKLVPVRVAVTSTDAVPGSGVAGFVLSSTTTNEGQIGDEMTGFVPGSGGSTATSGALRAERDGGGSGRLYTLTYTVTDVAGNAASCSATVSVPHDQGH